MVSFARLTRVFISNSKFAAILSIFFASGAFAKPITKGNIKAAHRIAIFMGTFDPINLGHIGAAHALLNETKADLVVFIPAPAPLRKSPLSLTTRLQLMNAALGDESQLVYPAETYSSSSELLRKIRSWNPNAHYSALIGDDKAQDSLRVVQLSRMIHPEKWYVSGRSGELSRRFSRFLSHQKVTILKTAPAGVSSSQARKILDDNPDLYFGSTSGEAVRANRQLDRLLPVAVKSEILLRGLYLDKNPATKGTFLRKLSRALWTRFVRRPLRAAGVSVLYKQVKVRRGTSKQATVFELEGTAYPIQKQLGAGAHGSVYQVTIHGTPFALKIPRGDAGEKKQLLRACMVQRWIEAHPGIASPRLILFDPNGSWSLSEMIEGQPLREYFERNKSIPAPLEKSLRELVNYSNHLSATSEIHLDLVVDNIIVKDNRAYLVDFGSLPSDLAFTETYEEIVKQWRRQAFGIGIADLPTCLRNWLLTGRKVR